MNFLETGQFYGHTNQTLTLGNLTLTDTEYTQDWVDWHFHENAYFTFILSGKVLEGNKKQVHHCTAGSLLFHNWQDAHYNSKPKGYTRGFHVEINQDWFKSVGLDSGDLQGSISLSDPHLKALMYSIVSESKISSAHTVLAVDALLANFFGYLNQMKSKIYRSKPIWVSSIRDLLHDAPEEPWTLGMLAEYLAIHPVHLCRDFPRYFNCNLGEYIRMARVQKAIPLLINQGKSLTEIAYSCGFSDQSHFIRTFRDQCHITPSRFRKLLQS